MSGKQENQFKEILSLLQKLSTGQQKPSKSAPSKKKKKKRKKKAKQAMNVANDGSITLSRKELLTTISIPANAAESKGHIDLIPDSFSFLKNVFSSFDRVKWLKLNLVYKPAVGTTYGGLITLGMDWDFGSEDVDRKTISGFTPSMTMSAWTDTERSPMKLPASRLQSRLWYLPRASDFNDKGPGKIHWAASGTTAKAATTLGEVWADYTLVMYGTNPK